MQRKIIKLTCLGIIILLVFEIYVFAKSNKINYVALGDALTLGENPYGEIGYSYSDYIKDYLKENKHLRKYTKEYAKSDNTATLLRERIKNNPKLKKVLRESDLVTMTIGRNDLYNRFDGRDIDVNKILELKKDIEKIEPDIDNLIKEVRKYAKKDLIIIGYYNPIPFLFNISSKDLDKLFAYIDSKYISICREYKCKYISTYELFKNNSYLPNPKSIYPNTKGYKAIADLIIKEM